MTSLWNFSGDIRGWSFIFQADDFILPETDFPDCEEQIQKSVDDFYSLYRVCGTVSCTQ